MAGHVLVGADGSESSLEAIAVAAHEARRRGLGMRIVHAFVWPMVKIRRRPKGISPRRRRSGHAA